MGDGGFFKGTSLEQDSRFSDKQKKLLKSMNFPSEFNQKVDLKKVNLTVIRPWVAQKIVELLGGEDEVVVNYVFGLLEEPDLDPRMMQINLTGFLEKNAPIFVTELWKLLLSAQEGENGIPAIFLEQKMEQIRRKKEEDERILLEIRKRREKEEEERIRLRDIRERERREDRERKEREHKPGRHRSRSQEDRRDSRSSRRRYSPSKSEENRRRRSYKRSKSRSRDHSRDHGRDRGREHSRERSREHRRHKSHRHSRSRSKERRRQEERRRRQKTPSRSREREDTTKRRRFSREEVITKESIDRVNHLSPEKDNRKDVVTDYDLKKRTVESAEENNSAPSSPPRKKVADGPIFKSKWNDDEEDEDEVVDNKKNSISDLEQLEQLRIKAFESMRNRK